MVGLVRQLGVVGIAGGLGFLFFLNITLDSLSYWVSLLQDAFTFGAALVLVGLLWWTMSQTIRELKTALSERDEKLENATRALSALMELPGAEAKLEASRGRNAYSSKGVEKVRKLIGLT
jgi:hypothetical protein